MDQLIAAKSGRRKSFFPARPVRVGGKFGGGGGGSRRRRERGDREKGKEGRFSAMIQAVLSYEKSCFDLVQK